MKNLFGLLFICTLFALTSCGGDDGCTEDLTGTYTGNDVCSGTTFDDVSVTISGTEGNYTISGWYSSTDVKQDGCDLSYSNTLFGVGEEVELSFSGNTLTLLQKESATGTTICTFTGTK